MLRGGMPVDVEGNQGSRALHCASKSNRSDVIKRLLYEGADVNIQDRYLGYTPLHFAALRNHTKAAQMLVDNGADINLKDEYDQKPLDRAPKGSEVERLLLQLQQMVP